MKLFSALLLSILAAGTAQAGEINVVCKDGISPSDIRVQLQLLPVEKHPELFVAKIKITGTVRGILDGSNPDAKVQVEGLLSGSRFKPNGIIMSGTIYNSGDDEGLTIINPQSLNLQGTVDADGKPKLLALYDTDHIFQLGYGLHMQCK